LATLASTIPEMFVGVESEKGSCDPDHATFRGVLSSIG